MHQIKDILRNRPLYSVTENQTVAEVARRMAELKVGAILVLNGRELRGVFSERDLMTRVVLDGLDPGQTPLWRVMTSELATIEDDASLERAMECMRHHNCRHLPVLRGAEVVGFLSMRDLMLHELADKTEELDHMRAYIHGPA